MRVTLKAARVNAGLTQEAAAKALGVSKSSLSLYERGRTSPSVSTVKAMEKLYHVGYDDLIFFLKIYA